MDHGQVRLYRWRNVENPYGSHGNRQNRRNLVIGGLHLDGSLSIRLFEPPFGFGRAGGWLDYEESRARVTRGEGSTISDSVACSS